MSMMGELKFFLRLQVHQSPHGIFISQSQYAIELLKKYGLDECVSMSTPMATKRLDADLQGTPTDQTTYRRMIGGLMYLTASHPDIAFATFVCALYQARPTVKHLKENTNFADLFTKALPKERFEYLVHHIVDHENVQCPPESKILTNIIKNHPLQFSIASSSFVPWIYMAQFWHALKEDGSKYRLKFMLDKKELSLTLDDFRTIFHLPHANENNHNSFVPPPSFFGMVPFYKQQFGFTIELKISPSFKTTGLLQPWQTLCKIFSKRLTTRVTGWDQPALCARDMYHNLQDDDIMKNIFNSRRHKDKVGMQIPDWMITEEMKHTEHYMMTLSAPRSPTHKKNTAESSAPKRSTMIHFRLPERRSTRLTPLAPVPTVNKADEMILQDTLQVSLAEQKSREEQEARENVELVNKHLASEAIEKMMEGSENVIDDSLPPKNDEPQIPRTRLEPRSDKESPEVQITNDEEVEITNVVIPVNVNEDEDEIIDEVYELKRREKGKIVKEKSFNTLADHLQEEMVESLPTMVDTHIKEQVKKQVYEQVRDQVLVYVAEGLIMERQMTKEKLEQMIAKSILQERGNIQAKISLQIQKAIDNHISSQVDVSVRSYMSGHILHVHPVQSQTFSVLEKQYQLPSAVHPRDQDDPHDNAHPEGENSAKRQKTSEYEAYVSGELSFGQVSKEEQGPSTSDDDEISMKQVSQDIIEEVSLAIDEAKLKKIADEMLRQTCTSGDKHQYHIDQMKNFLKSDIIWESRKEYIFV
ncbi:hypothetical protein Tco_0013754 [Tanacetum coccineum]